MYVKFPLRQAATVNSLWDKPADITYHKSAYQRGRYWTITYPRHYHGVCIGYTYVFFL